MMIIRQDRGLINLLLLLLLSGFSTFAFASLGDRLPEFRECVEICVQTNCQHGDATVPFHLRLMLWTCPSNCDYTCQHIITDRRVSRDPPMLQPVVQFHGKWPFHRFAGIQEPFSVVFSAFNFLAHEVGMSKIRNTIPKSYPLRKYYVAFGYFGLASWTFSMLFHTRDFVTTERLDYFAAGASVLYGLFFAPIRIFRLDRPTSTKQSLLRVWTTICLLLYMAHVSYLTLWTWDYTYNMAANVAVGIVQNLMWTSFSIGQYQSSKKAWTAWPGLIVAWIVVAMSMELLDFTPIWGMIDAHSLWHLGTVGPTIWWYNFLIKDAQQDMAGDRWKA